MSFRHALRRVAAVVGSACVIAGVPVTSAAAAPGDLTVNGSSIAFNTGVTTISLTTENTFVPTPSEVEVRFTRDGVPTDTFTAAVEPGSDGTTFTVKPDLLRMNPGAWNIALTGTTATPDDPPVGEETDSCVRCYTIVGYAPTVSGVSPSTIGQGATAKIFVKGTGFNNTTYCTSTPENCVGQPRMYVVPDTGLTLSGNAAPASGDSMEKALVVSPTAPTGPRDVYVVNTDNKTAKCTGCLVISTPPTVTPGQLGPNMAASRNVVVTGQGFTPGTEIDIQQLNGTEDSTIDDGATTVTSPTQMSVPVKVLAATSGFRSLKLLDGAGDGEQTYTDKFQVSAGPTISSVSYPANATATGYGQGAQSRVLRVTGAGFQDNATVAFDPATGITVVGTPVVTAPTQIDITVSLAQGLAAPAAGAKNVVVTNPDGGVTPAPTLAAQKLTVTTGPSITSVAPKSRARGATTSITITGTAFRAGDVTVLVPGVTVGAPTTSTTTQIVVPITIPADAAFGPRDVTVVNNDDKGQFTYAGGFSVDNLHVDSVSPLIAANEAQDITITGAGFAPDATVTLFRPNFANVVATATTVNAAGTSLTAAMPLHQAPPGEWGVRVTNPTTNAGTGTCDCVLRVVSPVPTIATNGVTPSSRGLGADNEKIEIVGTGFAPGAQVDFDDDRISVDTTKTVVTPTKITVYIDITGAWGATENPAVTMDKIHVVNADEVTASADFDVLKPPAVSTTTNPIATRAQGTTGGTFQLTGTDFTSAPDATVIIGGEGVTVGTSTVAQGGPPSTETNDTITASAITVAADAVPGPRDVFVRNNDGGRAKCTCTFVVSVPPTLSSVSPAKGARGTTVPFTLTGTGFASGATVKIGTLSATGVTVPSSTTLTGQVAIPAAQPLGTLDVVLTNTDGASVTKAGAFKVFTTPDAPTAVSATRGDGKVTVSWTAPVSDGGDPLTGYTVTSNPATTPVGAAPGATSVTYPGLTNGTAYTFTVVATNAAGNSPASAPSAPVTPSTVPGAPTNVTATPGNASATVSWTAPTATGGADITGYTVTSSPGGKTATAPANTTQAVVSGLDNGTAYTFTVVATNAAGDSLASAPSAAVTPRTVPGAPTDVTATPADGAANISWKAPESNGGAPITGYTVTGSGGQPVTVGGDTLSATVTGLTNGTPYTFTVTAANVAGSSAASLPSNAVTPRTIPGAPTSVTATRGDGSATVSWTAPVGNGGSPVTGYTVKSSPGDKTADVDATQTSAVVNGLTNGTAYTFTVVATNAAGNSVSSDPSNAVTPAGAPLAPTGVAATAGHAAARVTWTAADANGSPVTGYTVTTSPGGATTTVDGTSTGATVTGLTNGTLYTFTVTATNAVGTGPASAASNAVRPTWVTTLTEAATSRVTSGGTATVRGRLTRSDGTGLAGATVQIYRRVSPATTYSFARSVTTGADGSWSTTFTVIRNTRFQAVFAGAPGFDAATSPIRLTAAAYKISRTYSISGRTVTVKGSVSPNAAGRTIYLRHRRTDGSVVNITSATVRSTGTYTLTRTLPRGTYYLYVYIGSSTTNVAASTPRRTTTIS